MSVATIPVWTEPSEAASAEEVLEWGVNRFGDRLALCTSFQAEGMVLLDMAARLTNGDVRVFTIDTGRLPEETHELMSEVRRRYGIQVEVVFPDWTEVTAMVSSHGTSLFYDSVAKRRLCCHVRKVRPLAAKLKEFEAWVVGLRRDQSATRRGIRKIETDHQHGGICKLSPLADWTAEQVKEYTRRHGVPQHKLYAQGYTSIGCAPCTRPTADGEVERAGRWWWESGAKECGIHFNENGAGQRELDVLLDDVLRTTR